MLKTDLPMFCLLCIVLINVIAKLFFSMKISNSGFEFNMVPPSGEAISTMLPEQQWEMNKTVTAATSQQVSIGCSLNLFLFKPALIQAFVLFFIAVLSQTRYSILHVCRRPMSGISPDGFWHSIYFGAVMAFK